MNKAIEIIDFCFGSVDRLDPDEVDNKPRSTSSIALHPIEDIGVLTNAHA